MRIAVQKEFHLKATSLLLHGADSRVTDNAGFNALDYIFAMNSENLIETLGSLLEEAEMDTLRKYYSDKRLVKLRKQLKINFQTVTKKFDSEKQVDVTSLSETSKPITPQIPKSERNLEKKLLRLREKVSEAERRLSNLRTQKKLLVKKIKSKSRIQINCADIKNNEKDYVTLLMNTLTHELNFYTEWIQKYRVYTKPLYKKIFDKILSHVRCFYGDNASLSYMGSHANELDMPWSDINFLAKFSTEMRNDNTRCEIIKDKANQFAKAVKEDTHMVQSSIVEDNTSLIIVKIQLTNFFLNRKIEVILKYHNITQYYTNEEIVSQYLKKYLVAKPLYFSLRALLHRVGLDDPSVSGLKSNVIFMMVIAYLQMIESSNTIKIDTISLGQIFINLLFFYSYNFNYFRDYIKCYPVDTTSVNPIIVKDPRRKITSLMIVNPYNCDIIMTKLFKKTIELRQFIRLSYISLFNRCSCPVNRKIFLKPRYVVHEMRDGDSNELMNDKEQLLANKLSPVSINIVYQAAKTKPRGSLRINSGLTNTDTANSFSIPRVLPTADAKAKDTLVDIKMPDNTPLYKIYSIFNYNSMSNDYF